MSQKERADAILEMLQVVLEILVAVGVIIGYLKMTLSTAIHAIVDKMFMEQRITIDRQTQTLDSLDKTITKMNAIVERITDHQYSTDKELAMLGKDVKALHRRLDDHESRIENFCQFCNREHKGDMPTELLDYIAYGTRGRGRGDERN